MSIHHGSVATRIVRPRARHRAARGGNHLVLAFVSLIVLFFFMVTTVLGTGAAVVGYAVGTWFGGVTENLPSVDKIGQTLLAGSMHMYDRTGKTQLALRYAEDRDYVAFAVIPRLAIDATVAIEDRTFWQNNGVDPKAILRAAYLNLTGQSSQGASTITQQLVRSLLLSTEKTVERKVREAVLASDLTGVLSKEKILELYMNAIYYGNGAYGISAAARRYFSLPLSNLSLAQTALLAGLPQSPSTLDPFIDPLAARARMNEVLDAMVASGVITSTAATAATLAPWDLKPYTVPADKEPWFVDRTLEEATSILGSTQALQTCGCRIITTLDIGIQKIARTDLTTFIQKNGIAAGVNTGALVAQDPANGEVLAYVGSVDPANDTPKVKGGFDAAGLALRAPGSAWKPIDYLAAIEAGGLNAGSRVWDVPTTFAPGYTPQNAFLNFNGPITLRGALRESRNIPAIRTMLAYGGTDAMLSMAQRLGITRDFPADEVGPAMAIGSGGVTLKDMTEVYSTISNLGTKMPQHFILRIERLDGTPIWSAPTAATAGVSVVDPRYAFTLVDILKDNADKTKTWLTGPNADLGRPAFVKTGTDDDIRNVYAAGGIPQLTVGIWMGNADNSPMAFDFHSYTGPLVVWHTFLSHVIASRKIPTADWVVPSGMIQQTLCEDPAIYGGDGFGIMPQDGWCPVNGTMKEWVIPGFNDSNAVIAKYGLPFGKIQVDPATGRAFPTRCGPNVGYSVYGVLAKAERPEWQSDLETWVYLARSGAENQNGRFPWGSTNWILPLPDDAVCPAGSATPPPSDFNFPSSSDAPSPAPTPISTFAPPGGSGTNHLLVQVTGDGWVDSSDGHISACRANSGTCEYRYLTPDHVTLIGHGPSGASMIRMMSSAINGGVCGVSCIVSIDGETLVRVTIDTPSLPMPLPMPTPSPISSLTP